MGADSTSICFRANQAPPSRQAASTQNTGAIPTAVDAAPEASGIIVWLPLSSEVRRPTASPWRPGGDAAYSSDMMTGWALPRPRPSTNDSTRSGGTLCAQGNSR